MFPQSRYGGGSSLLCWTCLIQIIMALLQLHSRHRTVFPQEPREYDGGRDREELGPDYEGPKSEWEWINK
ncbi:hypothetical protein M8J75_003812 [Diaphorina citri]|nr:hypothetical protein M8J75_003812 [Diaphorina citri]